LLLLGLMAKLVGFCLLVFAGFEAWLVLTEGSLGSHLVLLVVGGSLAFALLSIGGSATKSGLKYLHGQKSVARDVGGFVARRIARRRWPRAR
jgi:hypothetical protein